MLTATFTPANASNYQTANSTLAAVVGTPDYSVTGPTTPLQITAGQTATANFIIASQFQFDSSVTFSCGTLPPGVTCSFSPSSVTGAGTTTVTLMTTAPSPMSRVAARMHPAGWWTLSGLSLVASVFLLGVPRTRRRMKVAGTLAVLCIVSLAVGCGSGSGGHNITKASTTTSLSSSSVKAASGSGVTLSATVASPNTVTGTMTFSDGATTLGSSSVASGAASLQTSSLSVGTHTIAASYSGDTNNNASSSSALNQVITGNSTVTITASSGSLSHTANLTITIQ